MLLCDNPAHGSFRSEFGSNPEELTSDLGDQAIEASNLSQIHLRKP